MPCGSVMANLFTGSPTDWIEASGLYGIEGLNASLPEDWLPSPQRQARTANTFNASDLASTAVRAVAAASAAAAPTWLAVGNAAGPAVRCLPVPSTAPMASLPGHSAAVARASATGTSCAAAASDEPAAPGPAVDPSPDVRSPLQHQLQELILIDSMHSTTAAGARRRKHKGKKKKIMAGAAEQHEPSISALAVVSAATAEAAS